MKIGRGQDNWWDMHPPPWATIVFSAGRPWLKTCYNGMLAFAENGENKVAYLKTAIRADGEAITIKPNDDVYVIPWKKITIISPTSQEAKGLHTISVRAKTHHENGSALQSIIGMISGSDCGPAFVYGHSEPEPCGDREFWRVMQFGFEDEIGALMFAGLVAGLQEEGKNCHVVERDEA